MEFRFQVYAKIAKPVAEVFDAVTDPKKLSAYFTTGGASGPLEEGATVTWAFGDFPGRFPVRVTRVVPDERIEFEWEVEGGGYDTKVEMTFEALDANTTMVRIAESGWKQDDKGLKASYGNCFGWTQMLCCLKVWIEHGVDLRHGFF